MRLSWLYGLQKLELMKQNFIVRQITEADFSPVYNLIKTAFETAEHRDGDEQDFAVNLRNGANYIPQLDLVAQLNGELIGHIMFTKTYVTQPDGSKYNTLLVAPLAVLLEYRHLGAGSALMARGLELAKSMGYQAAFLCGDPNYYQRLGYQPTHLYGIHHESIPDNYVMVCELVPACLTKVTGIVNM